MPNRVDIEGLSETRKALDQVAGGLDLRDEASATSAELGDALRTAASASGVPVAPRVARSIHATRAGVSLGGGQAVGARGAPASDLLWGSEHGGANFGVPAGGSYWIAPTVERYGRRALERFQRAADELIHRAGLD